MRGNRSAAARQERNSPAKSWREILNIHPAAELFPLMSSAEVKALAKDIEENGLQVPIAIWKADDGQKYLLDGRNRLDALELNGDRMFDTKGRSSDAAPNNLVKEISQVRNDNPYEYVVGANILRRHLTFDARVDLLDRIIKADPKMPSRRAAKLANVSPTTGAKRKAALEASGDVSTVDTSIDTLGRQQPAKRPKRTSLAAYAPPVQETLPERVKVNRRPSGPAATPPQPQAAESERRIPEHEDAEPLLADADGSPKSTVAEPAPTTEQISSDEYLLVDALCTLHWLMLRGDLTEKKLPAVIEAKPPLDYLSLLDLGKALTDIGHAWKLHTQRAQQHKPAQSGAVPSANDPGPMPDFLRRTPAGSNEKAAS
jgi:hypothetical protein